MQSTVFHLEKFPHFLSRIVALNRLYVPQDEVLDLLELDTESWHKVLIDNPEPSHDGALWHAIHARRILHTVHRSFPEQDPIEEQAAYVLRAFTGLAPFSEANSRTAWDYIAELLNHSGHSLQATWDEGRSLCTALWSELNERGFSKEILHVRDETHVSLAHWFSMRIA